MPATHHRCLLWACSPRKGRYGSQEETNLTALNQGGYHGQAGCEMSGVSPKAVIDLTRYLGHCKEGGHRVLGFQ